MALFSTPSHRSLKQIYIQVESAWDAGNFESAIEQAGEGLQLLSEGIDWPLKAGITNEKYVYPANFLLIRAKSFVALRANEHKGLPQELIEQLSADLLHAIDLCYGQAGGVPTYLHSVLELADVLAFGEVNEDREYVTKALEHLHVVQRVTQQGDKEVYAGALGREADLLQRHFSESPTAPERSITCLEKALAVFEGMGDPEMVFTSKSRLARFHLHPKMLQNPTNIEKGIAYAYSALDNPPADPGMERYMLLDVIGRAYAVRKSGDPMVNLSLSLAAFEDLLSDFSDDKNAELWAELVLLWANSLMDSGVLEGHEDEAQAMYEWVIESLHGGESRDLLQLISDRVQAVVDRLDPKQQPRDAFWALRTKFKLEKFATDWHEDRKAYVRALRTFQGKVDQSSDPNLWVDVDWEISLIELDMSNSQSVEACLKRLTSVMESHDFSQRRTARFETELLVTMCLITLDRWEEAHIQVIALMGDIFEQIEGDFRGTSKKLYALPGGPDRLRDLPIVAAKAGDVVNALAYLDVNVTAALASDLELLFMIDHQINRRMLKQTYMHIKQGKRLIHESHDKDYLPDAVRLEELQASLEIKRLASSEYLRAVVFRNLDHWLERLECWVFVPIVGNKVTRYLLIPPHSNTAQIIVSEDRAFGYVDLMKRLVRGEDKGGWITIQPRLTAEPTDENLDAIAFEFDEMRRYLWETYGEWIVHEMTVRSDIENRQLCVVANGTLGTFPFGMAYDEHTENYLLDYCPIQYAPSFYAIVSLRERLRQYAATPSYCAVLGEPDERVPFVPFGAQLGGAHFDGGKINVLGPSSYEVRDLAVALGAADHLQFSGHANFHWKDASRSVLSLSDAELPVDLLEGFVSDDHLRLVMLSACSTGLEETLEKDIERFGFSNKFLSLGALGVIVALWPLQDEASAFITERFYHYYQIENLEPAKALQRAQLWLRDLTYAELFSYLTEKSSEFTDYRGLVDAYVAAYGESESSSRPFEDPDYWAGFTLVGT